ncbi:MAG: alpha/beta hydrolase, partial [Elusimicrobia bacterium]|nr:alpha/beta hydrolase [Elusimicrobiota bacterium]
MSPSRAGNVRRYGSPPYRVAVLHGGPGAPGNGRLLAEELGRARGVLEPLQTADTLDGEVNELREQIEANATAPVTLIGSSWGAWLAYLAAARFPTLIAKLILVGCPPFEDWQSRDITPTRLRRLDSGDRAEVQRLLGVMGDPDGQGKDDALAAIGRLFVKADSVDPVTLDLGTSNVSFRIHSGVWKDATRLRARGELVAIGHHLRCPVVAIHGDRDPHPAEG